ncbi:XRE family transcriptional regulator [Microbacterium sp. CH12i]|nr:XRE family transcriptional regulator [Microbacterium sp. CH12i]
MARQNDSSDDEWAVYAQRLATSLRRARENAGLSQEQVAYRAGLTRYTYQKYEKGESRPGSAANPTLRTLLALSQVLELAIEQLIPEDPPDLRSR